jgi:nucleoid-associated protein YgaU
VADPEPVVKTRKIESQACLDLVCKPGAQPPAEANLVELRKVSSWQQTSFIEKGGWATLPGSDIANSSVARTCADMLASLK